MGRPAPGRQLLSIEGDKFWFFIAKDGQGSHFRV
jgi:hypothetical protein